MSSEIRALQPSALWNRFADLNAIPRPSKKEEKVIQFIKDFGAEHQLETSVDQVGNVIIRKPASQGMQGRKGIVLQSHLDMVHQKNASTTFDFDTQGIDMYIAGEWVKAQGTTLGADNGIGVAAILAILASNDIVHPDIEALFTIDEETGMTGAMGLKGGLLKGEILLNLDTEEDDEIDIGCAGGMDVTATRLYGAETIDVEDFVGVHLEIKGLNGGHSGVDIHKGLANANKIMIRLLFDIYENFGGRINYILGGSLRNAIPRESSAIVAIPNSMKEDFLMHLAKITSDIKKEFNTVDPNLEIIVKETTAPSDCMSIDDQKLVIRAIYASHNGVFRMSPDIDDLVEASNNVAKVSVQNGKAEILCLTRSSVESSKWDVANTLKSCFELGGFEVKFSGDYPGWTPNIHSPILKILTNIYEDLHQSSPKVVACHAGLECGILGKNYPNMDMISFGPTIKGAHSPDERVNIASTQKFWIYLLEVLKNIPNK